MSRYILYFSTGEIIEQEAPSSSHLYSIAKFNLRLYPTEFTACLCKKCNPIEEQHDTPIWIMTWSPVDKLEFSRWGEDKAHKLLARQTFLFKSPYSAGWTADWINRLFEMEQPAGRFILE